MIPFVGAAQADDSNDVSARGEDHNMKAVDDYTCGAEAGLAILAASIFNDHCRLPVERGNVGKVDPMFFQICTTFRFVPLEL